MPIVGSTVAKPGELLPMAGTSLRDAIEKPMFGRAPAPTRVRVASDELAEALRERHPGIEIVCAPTPELDEMLEMMRRKMDEDGATEQSYLRAPVFFDAKHDIMAELAALARKDDEVDPEAREPLEDELVRRFAESPEAKDLDEIQACRFVMDFASNYFGQTIATLGSSELRDIIFDIIPRKVSIDASEARWIIEENRAFYGFLRREYKLKQADACLKVLGGAAIKKLEAALSDSSNFGMAKSLLMVGADAGFDMQSKEDIEAWMQSVQGKPLPPSVRLDSFDAPPPSTKKAAKAKKNKRKAARKARKRNR